MYFLNLLFSTLYSAYMTYTPFHEKSVYPNVKSLQLSETKSLKNELSNFIHRDL